MSKAMSFCAYQERAPLEVREKLQEWGMDSEVASEIIKMLGQENFLNEERFARIFAGGKFRIKQWGRRKIEKGLREKGISQELILKGFMEIPESDYKRTLKELIRKKKKQLSSLDKSQQKQKIAKYLITKGYEPELVWEALI